MERTTLTPAHSDDPVEVQESVAVPLAHETDILYSTEQIHTQLIMYQDKTLRYVFRPARPAPALLRRIWAWF